MLDLKYKNFFLNVLYIRSSAEGREPSILAARTLT